MKIIIRISLYTSIEVAVLEPGNDDEDVQQEPCGVGDGLCPDVTTNEQICVGINTLPCDVQSQSEQGHAVGFLLKAQADGIYIDRRPADTTDDDQWYLLVCGIRPAVCAGIVLKKRGAAKMNNDIFDAAYIYCLHHVILKKKVEMAIL